MNPAKIILIGLDAADRGLVERWCNSGDLPVLRGMRDRGSHGRLLTPPGLADDSVWASFATAVSPGKHGRFFWQVLEPGSYETRMCREQIPPVKPFWVDLSEAGRRVAVVDVPKCPHTPGLNGIQISDWLVHGRDYAKTCSWPPELADSVLGRFGDDATDRPGEAWMCRMEALPEEDMPAFRRHLLTGIENKTRLASELLEQGEWDLFLVVFKEAHCVGHQCWPAVGRDDDPVKEVYQALDRAVGDLVERAGPQARAIVFSDIGMSSNETGEHFLNGLLQRLEPGLMTWRQRLRLIGRTAGGSREPANRLIYPLHHNEISGAIRFNLVGREPAGLVRPGQEESRLRQRLTEALLALRDPESGGRVVETVLDTGTVFPGDERERLPDLFAVWARQGPLTGAASDALGVMRAGPHGFRPGNHVPGGFFVSTGPGVAHGRGSMECSLLDVAPAVSRMLGVELVGREGQPSAAL
ncbi:MAG: alkaline phosphatase family protein [Bryobacteraceae bacterium]